MLRKLLVWQPDIVIASSLSNGKQLKILQNQKIRVLKIKKSMKPLFKMCEITRQIGKVLGYKKNAEKIIKKAVQEVEKIERKTAMLPKKKVFIQIGMKPLYSANKDSFINEYIKYGGGINIVENEKTGIYSREKVITQNPDIILIATMGTSKKAGRIEKQRWMKFKFLNAVINKQIYVLDP